MTCGYELPTGATMKSEGKNGSFGCTSCCRALSVMDVQGLCDRLCAPATSLNVAQPFHLEARLGHQIS